MGIFTRFAAAGVTHTFNLIDGLNGLSGYVSFSTAVSLLWIASIVYCDELTIFLQFAIFAIIGFFLLNFPFGKIFLGDGGAYLLGHFLVWSAIYLTNFDTRISPFAILLVFFWPVADTILAIWRRKILNLPTGHPDKLHFHQVVMRFLEIRILGRAKRSYSNPRPL